MIQRALGARHRLLVLTQSRAFAQSQGASWQDFKQNSHKYAKDGEHGRAEYERELKERSERKLNWGIKNRWEQRELQEIVENKDVRRTRFRNVAKLQGQAQLQEF